MLVSASQVILHRLNWSKQIYSPLSSKRTFFFLSLKRSGFVPAIPTLTGLSLWGTVQDSNEVSSFLKTVTMDSFKRGANYFQVHVSTFVMSFYSAGELFLLLLLCAPIWDNHSLYLTLSFFPNQAWCVHDTGFQAYKARALVAPGREYSTQGSC